VGAETAGDLAGGESQDGGADQPLGPGRLGFRQASLAQGGVDRVTDHAGRRGDRRPGQQQRENGRMAAGGVPDPGGEGRQALLPGLAGRGQRVLSQQLLDQPVEQRVLVIDVPVQGHRRDLQAPGDGVHGHRLQALRIGQRQCGGQHRPTADLRGTPHAGPLSLPRISSCQQKYIAYAYSIYIRR
jgi:hypothetical protein